MWLNAIDEITRQSIKQSNYPRWYMIQEAFHHVSGLQGTPTGGIGNHSTFISSYLQLVPYLKLAQKTPQHKWPLRLRKSLFQNTSKWKLVYCTCSMHEHFWKPGSAYQILSQRRTCIHETRETQHMALNSKQVSCLLKDLKLIVMMCIALAVSHTFTTAKLATWDSYTYFLSAQQGEVNMAVIKRTEVLLGIATEIPWTTFSLTKPEDSLSLNKELKK